MTIYRLAQLAGQQIEALGYGGNLHDVIMKVTSPQDIVNLWLDFLIDNRDSEAFRLRVDHAGNIRELIAWTDEARSALSVA